MPMTLVMKRWNEARLPGNTGWMLSTDHNQPTILPNEHRLRALFHQHFSDGHGYFGVVKRYNTCVIFRTGTGIRTRSKTCRTFLEAVAARSRRRNPQ
jgi:hypothetical protein